MAILARLDLDPSIDGDRRFLGTGRRGIDGDFSLDGNGE